LHNLDADDHLLLKEFDVVIPVMHKKSPLAYVFIGGFEENEDMYNKVQFITTLASEMQRMLIPAELPHGNKYEFSSIYKPQLGVGGDYFDVIQFDEDRIAFCVGDISGKGVAAALLMANFQANFHSLIRKQYPLDDFVKALNESVLRITHSEKFITFFVAEYNTIVLS